MGDRDRSDRARVRVRPWRHGDLDRAWHRRGPYSARCRTTSGNRRFHDPRPRGGNRSGIRFHQGKPATVRELHQGAACAPDPAPGNSGGKGPIRKAGAGSPREGRIQEDAEQPDRSVRRGARVLPTDASRASQPVEKVPRIRTPPGRKQESASIRGCGALFPQVGGPNRFRDSLHRLSRGGRTLPAPKAPRLRTAWRFAPGRATAGSDSGPEPTPGSRTRPRGRAPGRRVSHRGRAFRPVLRGGPPFPK